MQLRIPPVTLALLVANLGVFLLQYLIGDALLKPFALWPPQGVRHGFPPFMPWQLLTHGFMHQWGLAHIFFNMFALVMFGAEIERLFGARRYLFYYLLCIVGAALMYLIVVTAANAPPIPAIGASGGTYGLLLAYGMVFPHRKLVMLMLPFPMPAWLFVTLYGVTELVVGLTQTQQGLAPFAHLGGMVTGFVLIRYWRAQRRRG